MFHGTVRPLYMLFYFIYPRDWVFKNAVTCRLMLVKQIHRLPQLPLGDPANKCPSPDFPDHHGNIRPEHHVPWISLVPATALGLRDPAVIHIGPRGSSHY